MDVDQDNAAWYLAELGLLTLESVVEGDFVALDQSSRNRNLKILRRRPPGFFLKQARSPNSVLTKTLEREAACYRLAWRGPGNPALAALMPKFHHYDSENHILVVELIADAESLWERHQRIGRFPPELGRLQGELLGGCHHRTTLEGLGREADGIFDRAVPWILSIHETHPAYLQQLSQGNARLVQILRQHPEFPKALDRIRRSWKRRTLIHGDVKWENLVLSGDDGGSPGRLAIIDWEMADIGDERWDVGGVLQAYLSFWIFSLPLAWGLPLEEAASRSRFDMEEMRTAMGRFWSGYCDGREWTGLKRRTLEECLACAAARMIQTAYEAIQQSPELTPQAVCQLQMSMNILRDPAAGVRNLLGL